MAETLDDHQPDHEKRTLHRHCTCGWFGKMGGFDFTAHQSAILTAAGFGPVKTAAAGALRDAADGWSDWDALEAPEDWLRARAATIEGNPNA